MGQCLQNAAEDVSPPSPVVQRKEVVSEPQQHPLEQALRQPRDSEVQASHRPFIHNGGGADEEDDVAPHCGEATPPPCGALNVLSLNHHVLEAAEGPTTTTTAERCPSGKKASAPSAFRSIFAQHQIPPQPCTPPKHVAGSPLVVLGSPFSPATTGGSSSHRVRSAVVRIEESIQITLSAFDDADMAKEDTTMHGSATSLVQLMDDATSSSFCASTTWLRSVPLVDAGKYRDAIARPHGVVPR